MVGASGASEGLGRMELRREAGVGVAKRLDAHEPGLSPIGMHTPWSLPGGGPSGIGISSSLSTGSSSTPGGGPSGMTISSSESNVKNKGKQVLREPVG